MSTFWQQASFPMLNRKNIKWEYNANEKLYTHQARPVSLAGLQTKPGSIL